MPETTSVPTESSQRCEADPSHHNRALTNAQQAMAVHIGRILARRWHRHSHTSVSENRPILPANESLE